MFKFTTSCVLLAILYSVKAADLQNCGGFAIKSGALVKRITFGQNDLKTWDQFANQVNYQIDPESVTVTPGHVLQICANSGDIGCIKFTSSNTEYQLPKIAHLFIGNVSYAACFELNPIKSCENIRFASAECIRAFTNANCGTQPNEPSLSIVTKYKSWINTSDFSFEDFAFAFNPKCRLDAKINGMDLPTDVALSDLVEFEGRNWCSSSSSEGVCHNILSIAKMFIMNNKGSIKAELQCSCSAPADDNNEVTFPTVGNGINGLIFSNNKFVLITALMIISANLLTQYIR